MASEFEHAIAFLQESDPDARRRKKHRLPPNRYCLSDCEYFFTICARHLEAPFTNSALAEAVIEALLWRRQYHDWLLYCYCLMPDHLHFIVRLPEKDRRIINAGVRGFLLEGILDHVARFKRYTTNKIWWTMNGEGRLWQKSSYDRVIWDNREADAAVRYTLENPVRKGLVEQWTAYPYSAIVDWDRKLC